MSCSDRSGLRLHAAARSGSPVELGLERATRLVESKVTLRSRCRVARRTRFVLLLAFVVGLAHPAGAFATTHIPGTTYSTSTTWTVAGSPYVLDGSVTVAAGATLTIEPGVIVKLNGQFTGMTINGTLTAIGSFLNPITITSYKDDSAGGDTNGDGTATAPAPGQWYSLGFNSNTSQLTRVNVRYGGYGSNQQYGAISLWGSGYSVVIDQSTISKSMDSAIAVGGQSSVTLTNSLLNANGYGIFVNYASATVDHSTISDSTGRGVWFNLPTFTPYPPATTLMNSDITHNGGAGVYIGANGDYPLASMPHGNSNNIYANNNGGLQLEVSGYPGFVRANVDWKGNFWGANVYYWHHNSLCDNTSPYSHGHLAYQGAGGNVPPGPISWGQYYVQPSLWTVYYCGWDAFEIGPNEFSPTYIDTAGRLSAAAALAQFTPEIRYDAQESFRADAADEITDNWTSDYTNKLQTLNYGYLAAADPNQLGVDDLYLGYLGSTYPGNRTATADDFIDEMDPHIEDAGRLHALPTYGNKIYGRTVHYDNGDRVVQYWLFYYFNDRPLHIGDHEGDWEMVQYLFDYNGNPVTATYAQHQSGERCDWIHVQRTPDGHPVVYPGVGTHASYFSAGSHLYDGGAVADSAGGDGDLVIPAVTDFTATPAWLNWPGKWGGSDASPQSPLKQGVGPGGKWDDPRGWANGVPGCTEGQTYPRRGFTQANNASAGRSSRVPLPAVTASRQGRTVTIRYRFRVGVRLDRLELLSSVDSTSDQSRRAQPPPASAPELDSSHRGSPQDGGRSEC